MMPKAMKKSLKHWKLQRLWMRKLQPKAQREDFLGTEDDEQEEEEDSEDSDEDEDDNNVAATVGRSS